MAKRNGGVIGKVNTPTTSTATGVWRLQDQFNAKKNSINVFLAREYNADPHLKDMNEKMVLLFYEPKV